MSEISTKPYLLRALYEWCVDNGYTPHLAVRVDARTQVPTEHVRNGEITLNISPTAVHKLQIGKEQVEFSARFGGVARQIFVPIEGVMALYARETGQGMSFEVGSATTLVEGSVDGVLTTPVAVPATPDGSEPPKPAPGGRPGLRRVK